MNANKLRSYRFSTSAQWSSCLFAQADRDELRAKGTFRPFRPYTRPATLYESHGAHAPVVTRTGEILWCDSAGDLHRISGDDTTSEATPAPSAIGQAARIVAASNGLWVHNAHNSVQFYETDTLTRVITVELPNTRVVDIADGGQETVAALVESAGKWQSVRMNRAGNVVESVDFTGISQATAFVFLRRTRRFVVLAGVRHPRLYWFPAEGGQPIFSVLVAAVRPCFKATALGSDSRDRIFLAGSAGDESGPEAFVLVLDADGNLVSDVPLDPLDTPATGIAAARDNLLVAGARGLLRFAAVESVPETAGEARCLLITPMLLSAEREAGPPWLRIEASATLPQGSKLEISYAATDDAEVRDRLQGIAQDVSLTASHRVQMLLSEPDIWQTKTVFHGSEREGEQSTSPRSAPLFNVRKQHLWVCLELTSAPGARLPSISELAVLYPGHSLMENLPSVYRRTESDPNDFVRALVGVLEATTQDLDGRIASMGSRVHPSTASGPWLDYIARWLGLPWDDGLSDVQKKALVSRAPDLAKGRGTRAGLEALLESLLPDAPRRFRVTDATADFGFAVVGGEMCAGSALPAMLGGLTRWSAELGSRTVLGYMRLPCPGQVNDPASRFAGKIRVEVAATAEERKAWEPWLLTLITEMVPLTARVDLRWVSAHALRTDRLDGTLTLESAPLPHLGTGAVTGLARLPEVGARLSSSGTTIGTRLR